MHYVKPDLWRIPHGHCGHSWSTFQTHNVHITKSLDKGKVRKNVEPDNTSLSSFKLMNQSSMKLPTIIVTNQQQQQQQMVLPRRVERQ